MYKPWMLAAVMLIGLFGPFGLEPAAAQPFRLDPPQPPGVAPPPPEPVAPGQPSATPTPAPTPEVIQAPPIPTPVPPIGSTPSPTPTPTLTPTPRPTPTPITVSPEPGYLGLTADTVAFGNGAQVLSVVEGSPAAKGLFQTGDLIRRINGKQVDTVEDMARALQGATAGQQVAFEVLRGAKAMELRVELGIRPAPLPPEAAAEGNAANKPLLGVMTSTVDAIVAARLGLPIRGGALIDQVIADSPAGQLRIPAGAVIVRLDDRVVGSPDDLREAVSVKKPGDVINLQYYEGTRLRSVFLRLGTQAAAVQPPSPNMQQRLRTEVPQTRESVLAKQAMIKELEAIRAEIEQLELRAKLLERQIGP